MENINPNKSLKALRTIGEVSEFLNLPPHVLRFWESKFTQIKPVKRRGGHRYYRPDDIEVLREIKSLLYDRGYTIKGAQKFLKDAKKAASQDISTQTATPNAGAVGSQSTSERGTSAQSATQAIVNNIPAPTNAEHKKRLTRILNELVEIRGMLTA